MRIGAGTGTTGLSWLLSDYLGSQAITADNGVACNEFTNHFEGNCAG